MAQRKGTPRTERPEATALEPLYTTTEVAALLKVMPRTVQHWIRVGKLPAVRYGRLYRVRAADLARFGQETGMRTQR
jgi:excisionase family DNA binding protein